MFLAFGTEYSNIRINEMSNLNYKQLNKFYKTPEFKMPNPTIFWLLLQAACYRTHKVLFLSTGLTLVDQLDWLELMQCEFPHCKQISRCVLRMHLWNRSDWLPKIAKLLHFNTIYLQIPWYCHEDSVVKPLFISESYFWMLHQLKNKTN